MGLATCSRTEVDGFQHPVGSPKLEPRTEDEEGLGGGVLSSVGLNTIIARYSMKTLEGTNPSARGKRVDKGREGKSERKGS